LARGQIISSDFMISIAIFLLVLSMVIPVYMQMSNDMRERSEFESMQTTLIYSSGALMKTQGLPNDWNSTNVSMIGIADQDGKINQTKIRNLMQTDTETVKTLLGISGYDFNITFRSGNFSMMTGAAFSPAAYFCKDERTFLGVLNSSGLVYDLYYSGNMPIPEAGRKNFTGPGPALFNQMMADLQYRTVILEDPGLAQGDINMTLLQDFLRTGGIIIIEGDAQLIATGFSIHANSTTNQSSLSTGSNLLGTDKGVQIDFNNTRWYVYSAQGDSQIAAAALSPDGGAFSGSWKSFAGKIYFIADIEGSANGKRLTELQNIIGRKAELQSGAMQFGAAQTIPVIYDTDLNSLGTATMVVGR
jgi:hypothetical protein